MSSMRKPSSQKPIIGTTLSSARRDEGDWKSLVRNFKEEVGRLKEENVNLQTSRVLLVESWQDILKRMEFLTDENRVASEALLTLLNQEREKVESCSKENRSLLKRLKESEEACTVQQAEIKRLLELSEKEKKAAEVYVRLCEERSREENARFQVELQLRDQRVEEARRELSEHAQRHAVETELERDAFEAERLRWAKLREGYEAEISQLHAQVSKLECFSHQTPYFANKNVTDVSEDSPLASSYDHVCANASRNVSKKSRLEAARMQRRQKEQISDTTTLISLTKLSDLQENFRV